MSQAIHSGDRVQQGVYILLERRDTFASVVYNKMISMECHDILF